MQTHTNLCGKKNWNTDICKYVNTSVNTRETESTHTERTYAYINHNVPPTSNLSRKPLQPLLPDEQLHVRH